ncbi:hypothetical protein ACLKA6_001193 [Drosophila palustris]
MQQAATSAAPAAAATSRAVTRNLAKTLEQAQAITQASAMPQDQPSCNESAAASSALDASNSTNHNQAPTARSTRELDMGPVIDLDSNAFLDDEYTALKTRFSHNKDRFPDMKIIDKFLYIRTEHAVGDDAQEKLSWKLWVPESLRNDVLRQAHDNCTSSHAGMQKCIEKQQQSHQRSGSQDAPHSPPISSAEAEQVASTPGTDHGVTIANVAVEAGLTPPPTAAVDKADVAFTWPEEAKPVVVAKPPVRPLTPTIIVIDDDDEEEPRQPEEPLAVRNKDPVNSLCGNNDYPSNPCSNKDPVTSPCGSKDQDSNPGGHQDP